MGNSQASNKQKICPYRYVDIDETIKGKIVAKPKPRALLVETSIDILDMSVSTCNSDSRSCSRRIETSGGNFILSTPTTDCDAVLEEVKEKLRRKSLMQSTHQPKENRRRVCGGRSPSRRGTMSPPREHSLDVIPDSGVEMEESYNYMTQSMEGKRKDDEFLTA